MPTQSAKDIGSDGKGIPDQQESLKGSVLGPPKQHCILAHTTKEEDPPGERTIFLFTTLLY